MSRLIEEMVLSGLVMACRRATWPTIRSPVLGLTATTEGNSRPPSELEMIVGSPPSITAHTELVVPRSMPIIFAIITPPSLSLSDSRFALDVLDEHRLEVVVGQLFCYLELRYGTLNPLQSR